MTMVITELTKGRENRYEACKTPRKWEQYH